MNIAGYTKVTYKGLQTFLHRKWTDSDNANRNTELAIELKVKSQTIKNAFNTDMQVVSDKILSSLMISMDCVGFIVWENGVRNYYIKK